GSVLPSQDIHPGDPQTQYLTGPEGYALLLRSEPNHPRRPSPMKIGSKFSLHSLSLHRSHDVPIHHKNPDVGSRRFPDELLQHGLLFEVVHGLQDSLGALVTIRDHHPQSMGTVQKFDNDRQFHVGFEKLLIELEIIHDHRIGDSDMIGCEMLQATEFVDRKSVV